MATAGPAAAAAAAAVDRRAPRARALIRMTPPSSAPRTRYVGPSAPTSSSGLCGSRGCAGRAYTSRLACGYKKNRSERSLRAGIPNLVPIWSKEPNVEEPPYVCVSPVTQRKFEYIPCKYTQKASHSLLHTFPVPDLDAATHNHSACKTQHAALPHTDGRSQQ